MLSIQKMDTVKGSVLLDFSDGASQWTQSGYRIDNLVLTVTSPSSGRFFNNLVDNATKKVSGMPFLKITCYQMDGSKLRVEKNCRIRNIWESTKMNGIINELTKSNVGPYTLNATCSYTVSKFLLIDLNNSTSGSNNIKRFLDNLSNYSKSCHLFHGQNVFTDYTPFGANEFMNSCSRGCLCNTIKDILFLIDGRLAPGCEGAPVFTKAKEKDREYPIGLVLFPIALGNDHSSYSLVVPMHTVITTLLESGLCIKPTTNSYPLISSFEGNIQLQGAVSNTVVVQTTAGWGSGIVIGAGLVLTNSHVVGFGTKTCEPVHVCWNNRTAIAKVVFCSNTSSVLDIALLEYNKAFGPTGITFSSMPVEKGENVIALGHPLQNASMPSISKGVILSCFEGSVGFTTSCIINAGSSGGPIVQEDGTLIGIAVGIIKAGTLPYPEMNVCISASIFKNPLLKYQSSGETDHWNVLVSYEDPWLRALRTLQKCKY